MDYSILCATHNGEDFILEQANSWFKQKYQPKQIVIADDNSQDKTVEILISIFEKNNFKNYIILNNSYANVKKNFLYSLHNCNQDWIFFSDQDDIWATNKIEKFTNLANQVKNNFPTLLYADSKLVDKFGNSIEQSFFTYANLKSEFLNDDSICLKNCVQGANCAFNYSLKNMVLESLEICKIENLYMHDWWIALIAKYFGQCFFIDEVCLDYRQHDNNFIGAKNAIIKKIFKADYLQQFKQLVEFEKFCAYKKKDFSKNKLVLEYAPYSKKMLFKFAKFLNLLR